MDIRYSLNDVIRQEIETALMNLYTTIPAIVQSFNSTKQTVDVEVAVETPTYLGDNIAPSKFKDIPVIFPSANDWVIAGPVSVGDSVVLLVPHYGTEEYFSGKKDKVGKPQYVNRHDLNDAVALVGMFTSSSVTRKDQYKDVFHLAQGDNVIAFDDTTGITITTPTGSLNIPPSGDMVLTGNLTVNGNVTVTGTTSSTGLVGNGIDMVAHTHPYTDDGNNLVTGTPT